MLFHRKVLKGREFGPQGDGSEKDRYEIIPLRIVEGFLLFFVLIGASITCRLIKWDEGATTFLNLVEMAGGGLGGLFFGERLALNKS